MLGYGGHCLWVVLAWAAMVAFLVSSILASSSPSPHFSQLMLPQTLFWRCLPWLLGNEENQLSSSSWGLENHFSHLGNMSLQHLEQRTQNGGENGASRGNLSLPFLWIIFNDLVSLQQIWTWGLSGLVFWALGLIDGWKPFIFYFLATADHWV